jgi:hypothetical protein
MGVHKKKNSMQNHIEQLSLDVTTITTYKIYHYYYFIK